MVADSKVCCYIFRTHFDTFYVGITNNLERRTREHIGGKSSYLGRVKPDRVVYVEYFDSRKLARCREVVIKRIGGSNFLKLCKFNSKYIHLNQFIIL
jgi:predicted GIY-YIG superfamily endonuclease